MEDRRRRRVAFEDASKRMLRYLEDSEDLKVIISELKGQLDTPEEEGFSIMQIAQQARNDKGQKIFETFRQGAGELYIASLARWDTQLKDLAELERQCQDMIQEVVLGSEGQEVLKGMVEDKIRLQSKATEKNDETTFEELRELEVKKSKEALLFVETNHILIRCQSERDKARKLQRLGGLRVMRSGSDTQDTLSFESCSSSMACDVEEVGSDSSRKMRRRPRLRLRGLRLQKGERGVEAGTRRGNEDAGSHSLVERG